MKWEACDRILRCCVLLVSCTLRLVLNEWAPPGGYCTEMTHTGQCGAVATGASATIEHKP
jgi:hypothetical protein